MDWFGKADSWDIFERTHGCFLNDVIESLSEQILYIPSLLSAYDGPYGLLAWLAGLLAGWLVGLADCLAGWPACWLGWPGWLGGSALGPKLEPNWDRIGDQIGTELRFGSLFVDTT